MAGSLNHMVGKDGQFTLYSLDNGGDMCEALHECFHLILAMSGGKASEVNKYCKELGFPSIRTDMKATDMPTIGKPSMPPPIIKWPRK